MVFLKTIIDKEDGVVTTQVGDDTSNTLNIVGISAFENVTPNIDASYDFGSSVKRWNKIWANSLDIKNTLSASSGTITISGSLLVSGTTDITGTIKIDQFASLPRYVIVSNSGTQAFTGSVHRVVQFNGRQDGHLYNPTGIVDGGLVSFWNTGSNKIQPTHLGRIYTFNLHGILKGDFINHDSRFHMDFEVSGVIPTISASYHSVETVHRQAHEVLILKRADADHVNYSFNGFFITDAVMLASGAQFYASVSDEPADVIFTSASLFIKEG